MGKYPTLSDATLPESLLLSRRVERDAVLEGLELSAGDRVLDLQSAAGFLADEIHRRWEGKCTVSCIEPSRAHRQRIASHHHVVADELDDMASLGSDSFAAVLGLAGLHHSAHIDRTLSECARVLKPGGVFSVCDVEKGSNEARWLEEVVGRYGGSAPHDGHFLHAGEVPRMLEEIGFTEVGESKRHVPWTFRSNADMRRFLREFFDLQLDGQELTQIIEQFLSPVESSKGVMVPWSLLYWRATLP